MTNDEWLKWYNEMVEQERELEHKRELLVIKGVVLIFCLVIASVYIFAKYWTF